MTTTPDDTYPHNPHMMTWAGYVISTLPVLMLMMSAYFKFAGGEKMAEGLAKSGWTMDLMRGVGVVELICVALYIIPQTAGLGAILLTGYLGGAVATHVRIGDGPGEYFMPILLGVMLWGGLWLRDPRVRQILPFRAI
ncbi:MAG: DoxX family protein [Pirellulales bacterium]|nr:DoxX family protein [Pirellulales bacterium]